MLCTFLRDSPNTRSPRMFTTIQKAFAGRASKCCRSITPIFFLAIMVLVGVLPEFAQSGNASDVAAPDRSYKLLREDENWSFLQNPALRQDFWDPIKYIRLRHGRPDWYMTIGGEAREVWEQIGNDNWGEQPYMNGYLNERYMLSFDVHYGEHLRTFVELKSGLNSFRIGGPRPIDEKNSIFKRHFFNSASLQAGSQSSCWWDGRSWNTVLGA